MTRRDLLAGAAATLAGPPVLAAPVLAAPVLAESGGRRLVCLDWGLAQTALALGAVPVGLSGPPEYRAWVIEPALPPGVQDVGQRTQPNLEVVAALRPDAILAVPDHDPIHAALSAIAPVLRLPINTPAQQPWRQSAAAARQIAAFLGDPAAGEALVARVDAQYAAARASLAGQGTRPLLLASFLDPRHLSVYGPGNILHDCLGQLGLRNAWAGETGRWGSATVALEGLAALGDAALFIIEPQPPDLGAVLGQSPLWQALGFVRAQQVWSLPPVLMFGTLPAAERFASLLLPQLRSGAARV